MTNEAVLKRETSIPISFTVADGTGIEQGAILKLSDANTAALSDGDQDYIAGIAAQEKIANDGKTSLAVYTGGDFMCSVNGTVTAGQALATSSLTTGSNILVAATATAIGTKTFGVALEAHSGATSQILVRLQPGVNNTAYV